jgi:hypothetical protein
MHLSGERGVAVAHPEVTASTRNKHLKAPDTFGQPEYINAGEVCFLQTQ